MKSYVLFCQKDTLFVPKYLQEDGKWVRGERYSARIWHDRTEAEEFAKSIQGMGPVTVDLIYV